MPLGGTHPDDVFRPLGTPPADPAPELGPDPRDVAYEAGRAQGRADAAAEQMRLAREVAATLQAVRTWRDELRTRYTPTLVALSLTVPDLAATAAWLDHHDVPYRRDSAGTIGVPPAHTHGVMLEFVASGRVRDQDLP